MAANPGKCFLAALIHLQRISQRRILVARNLLYRTTRSMYMRYSNSSSLRGEGGEEKLVIFLFPAVVRLFEPLTIK